MRNKLKPQDSWKPPTISRPTFRVLTEEETAAIRGGAAGVGTCVGIGYVCWDEGGFHVGACLIPGAYRKPPEKPPEPTTSKE